MTRCNRRLHRPSLARARPPGAPRLDAASSRALGIRARLCHACRPIPGLNAVLACVTGSALLLHCSSPMNHFARPLVLLALFGFAGCGVAVAGGTEEEVPVSSNDDGTRVLGKRAFDAAASGHAPFEPLVGEAPQRTLVRAGGRIEDLERDLAVMQRHHDPENDAVVAELGRARDLVGEARRALVSAQATDEVDPAALDAVVALVEELRLVLHGAREQRLLAAA